MSARFQSESILQDAPWDSSFTVSDPAWQGSEGGPAVGQWSAVVTMDSDGSWLVRTYAMVAQGPCREQYHQGDTDECAAGCSESFPVERLLSTVRLYA